MERVELRVDGMTCGHCEEAVRSAVGVIAGVTAVRADHSSGRVEMDVEGGIDLGAVNQAIEEAGYQVIAR